MLKRSSREIAGKRVVLSGSGNVALYAAEKIIMLGGKPVSLSDSSGTIYDPDGITLEKLAYVKDLKEVRRGRISEYAEKFGVEFQAGQRPWKIPCDIALPCATQNELEELDAKDLVNNGCYCVAEGANMPSTLEAMRVFLKAKVLFGPAKAANAGGVAVSGLEQSQNAQRLSWSSERVEKELRAIMESIHTKCVDHGQDGDFVNYVKGANVAGFIKVANAMLAYGVS